MPHQSSLLKPEDVLKHWPVLNPHIETALEHSGGELSLFDVAQQAMNGQYHVWVTFSGEKLITVIVTRFLTYQRTKMLQIMTCGGTVIDWDGWTDHHRLIEDFAKKNECSAIEIWGRKGWGRRLKSVTSQTGHPYRPLYSVFSMEI